MFAVTLKIRMKKTCNPGDPKRRNPTGMRGFTLVEMSIVIMLLGIAIAAFAPLYKLYLKDRADKRSSDNITLVTEAIGNFRSVHGRYPCPASLSASRGNTNYGREDCRDMTVAAAGTFFNDVTIPNAPALVGIEQAIAGRSMTYTNPFTGAPVTQPPRVRVGSVPFRQLNLDDRSSYDGYDHRILYVVTEHLAFNNAFSPTQGGIEIVDENDVTVLGPTQSGAAHFLVFSSGEDSRGAFGEQGGLASRIACGGIGLDIENCNVNPGGVAIYRNSEISNDIANASRFDDSLSYFTLSDMPLWLLSTNVAVGARGDMVHKNAGDIGFGVTAMPGTPIDKAFTGGAGIVMATDIPTSAPQEGRIITTNNQIGTDSAAANQFRIDLIGGPLASGGGMSCPAGQYMVGIANRAPICRDQVTSQCGAGQVLRGVNPDGSLDCIGVPPRNCGARDIPLCAGHPDAHLAAGNHNTTQTVTVGDSYTQTFRCNDGSWQAEGAATGVCECTAGTAATGGLACGGGFSGTYTSTCVTTCGPHTVTCTNDRAAACTCVGGPDQVNSVSCPPGYTSGSGIERRTFNCALPGYNPPTYDYSGCLCTPSSAPQTRACSSGFTGIETRTASFTCPGGPNNPGVWSYTPWDSSSCTCTGGNWTQNDPCPAGYTGYIQNRYTIQCPGGTTSVTEIARTCVAIPVNYSWKPNGSPELSGGGGSPRINNNCTTPGATRTCYQKISGTWYRLPCICQP